MTTSKTLPALTLKLAPPDFQFDKRNDGWKLMKDLALPTGQEANFELAEFLKKREESVNGKVMVARAKKLEGLTGQKHAELLLRNAGQIPKDWRAFYLVFPGTHWQRDGDLGVPYLGWHGDRWSLDWYWLECGWDSSGRLVRLRK